MFRIIANHRGQAGNYFKTTLWFTILTSKTICNTSSFLHSLLSVCPYLSLYVCLSLFLSFSHTFASRHPSFVMTNFAPLPGAACDLVTIASLISSPLRSSVDRRGRSRTMRVAEAWATQSPRAGIMDCWKLLRPQSSDSPKLQKKTEQNRTNWNGKERRGGVSRYAKVDTTEKQSKE